jgi:hypothetical protein
VALIVIDESTHKLHFITLEGATRGSMLMGVYLKIGRLLWEMRIGISEFAVGLCSLALAK